MSKSLLKISDIWPLLSRRTDGRTHSVIISLLYSERTDHILYDKAIMTFLTSLQMYELPFEIGEKHV